MYSEKNTGKAENRYYPRFTVALRAFYEFLEGNELACAATIVNLSASGFCFATREDVPLQREIKLTVELNSRQHACILVEAMWCTFDPASGSYRVGAKIVESPTTDFEKLLVMYCQEVRKFYKPQTTFNQN